MTWDDPTVAEVRAAYEESEFDYRTAPSVRVLLAEIDQLAACRELLKRLLEEGQWSDDIQLEKGMLGVDGCLVRMSAEEIAAAKSLRS